MTLSELTTISESVVLVPGAAGGRPALFEALVDRLFKAAVPDIAWSVESVSTGLLASILGLRRDVFVGTFAAFPEHVVLIRGENCGTAFAVSFTIAVRERLSRTLRRALLFRRGSRERDEIGSELSSFATTELAARIAIVRAAFDDALATLSVPDARSDPWDIAGDRGNPEDSGNFSP